MIVTAQDYHKELRIFLDDLIDLLGREILSGVPTEQYMEKIQTRNFILRIRDEANAIIKKAQNA